MPRPRPAFLGKTEAFGEAGSHCIGNLKAGDHQRAASRDLLGAPHAVDEDAIQLPGKLAAESPWVGHQREPVDRAGELDRHRFDSGSSRCARAAATWSASRRASARATARPCVVMR